MRMEDLRCDAQYETAIIQKKNILQKDSCDCIISIKEQQKRMTAGNSHPCYYLQDSTSALLYV